MKDLLGDTRSPQPFQFFCTCAGLERVTWDQIPKCYNASKLATVQKERPNKTIRKYVEGNGAKEWAHADTAKKLYELYDVYRRFFFAPDTKQKPLPQAVIAIDELRVDTLAAYRIVPNPTGLPFEISMNAKHLSRPLWEQAESLLHETVHLYQEDGANNGNERFPGQLLQNCRRGYHNKQFIAICEELGLHPMLGLGCHLAPADGQFERLMVVLGVEKPEHAKNPPAPPADIKGKWSWWDEARGKARGTSTLTLYECETCPLTSPCKVRSGRKNLHLGCTDCSGTFVART